jgi:hypothetical protein
VINPVIQYTVFEQLKNFLIENRTKKLRAKGAVAILSDWDFFFLGALSKLGTIPQNLILLSLNITSCHKFNLSLHVSFMVDLVALCLNITIV